ncbi:MAG: hypothetical protein H6601_05430 [Flavobacteriales bacterium]|nr:hypothetical protein [Flavobacteriales bacterium]
MKHLLFALSVLSFTTKCQPVDTNKAQDGKYSPYMGQDFVLYADSEDTIFCDKVDLLMQGQRVNELSYTIGGETKMLKGGHVLKLKAFYANGMALMELMPTVPDEPDGNKQHLFKNLVGYFTIWSNNHSELYKFQRGPTLNVGSSRGFRTSFHLISIEGGPIFNPAEKGAKKKIIKPLLETCEGIQESSRTYLEVNKMELIDQCFDYNRLCAPDYGQ